MANSQVEAQELRADDVHGIERLIQQGDLLKARTALRHFLFSQAGEDGAEGSIGDALAILARQPVKNPLAAIVFLRCQAVHGLVPSSNEANHISRSAVELCEGALPEILTFLRLDKKAQNYEKFAAIAECHLRITEILNPLRHPYGDLDAILAGRKEVLGSLNHSLVRKYCGPFRLNEIKSTAEAIFSKLKQVSALDVTLLSDIEECNRCVDSAKADFCGSESFLTEEYLGPFLTVCRSVLSEFLKTQRAKFKTIIVWGQGSAKELQKRYPLQEPERELQIVIPLRNTGPGLATDVRVTVTSESSNVVLGGQTVMLGNVLPGDFSIAIDAMVISAATSFQALLQVEWGEIGSPTRDAEIFEFNVISQRGDIEWQNQEYRSPYSTGVAEGDQFHGRMDRVRHLAARLLRQPMEPFYITGQKRVGKTSLALASARYALAKSPHNTLIYHYILWGEIAHADPNISLRQLGESVEEFIFDRLTPDKRPAKGDYNGSLAGLVKLSNAAKHAAPEAKFVIIIDEFDEIHQELFIYGNLAETFFANLRALSRLENICIVLIGGENMPFIMDRQGQKLNNFSRENLSYFSRQTEWTDFQLVVREPTSGLLNWHDDAISEVFNTTRGNPYFAKIICAAVFRCAVSERDADVTATEVRRATESATSGMGANSFAHLWQDGIPKAAAEREPDILRRMRLLVAIARCLRRGLPTTASNIASNRSSVSLTEGEIPAVLNDFQRREILHEEERHYVFVLPIFHMWLVDVGVSQLIADALNEELANIVLVEENAAIVRSQEVVSLADRWPTYRGKHVGTDEIRAWYQQVESPRDQRLLFELLNRVRVFSESHVRERLKNAHSILRSSLPEFIIRKRNERRTDVLLTYIDGEGKSGANYASLYAEENGIAADCVIGPSDFRARYTSHLEKHGRIVAVIVIDDIAATGSSLSNNISKFVSNFRDLFESVKVRIVTIVATEVAQKTVLMELQKANDIDIDFRSCEILTDADCAFPSKGNVWRSSEEEARAKALCVDLGSRIYKQNPLGYGGLGLLVVFPTTVPNNSLPILHTYARTGSGQGWKPLFPRVVN